MSVSVCLSVCLCICSRAYRISWTTRPIFSKILCLLPVAAAAWFSFGSVADLQHFGFVDDVVFSHNGHYMA